MLRRSGFVGSAQTCFDSRKNAVAEMLVRMRYDETREHAVLWREIAFDIDEPHNLIRPPLRVEEADEATHARADKQEFRELQVRDESVDEIYQIIDVPVLIQRIRTVSTAGK